MAAVYLWFARTSSKIKINDFSDKTLHNVDNAILKNLCKFQVDVPINTRVIAVQSLENLYTFILRQPCWLAKECLPAHFQYNIIENSRLSLAHKTVFVDPNNFKFGTDTHYMVFWTTSKFGIN